MDEMYGLHSSSSTGGWGDDHYSDNRGLMMLSDSDNLIMNPAALDNYNNNNYYYYHEYHHHHPMIPAVVFGSAEELWFQCSESVAQDLLDEDHEHAASTTHHDLIKSKIASHPAYPKLIDAYIDCQKVGAPPEIAGVLDEIRREKELMIKYHDEPVLPMCLGLDPELDEFMETYYDMLVQYKSDLSRPFDEAISFLNKIQTQLGNLSKGDGSLSSDEEVSGGETETHDTQMKSEDRELKERLFRKYGSQIGSLKQELSKKKKKKGKLPKEARQILLEWWNVHCKWPYPTEADKFSLAESTGLDQKQINNWFINQRKRHWKPSENMQMTIMDNLSGHFFGED